MHQHVIDNSNNEIRSSGVKRDAGGDEKQLIKFAWPNRLQFILSSRRPDLLFCMCVVQTLYSV